MLATALAPAFSALKLRPAIVVNAKAVWMACWWRIAPRPLALRGPSEDVDGRDFETSHIESLVKLA